MPRAFVSSCRVPFALLAGLGLTGACAGDPVASPEFPAIPFQSRSTADARYVFHPGDSFEVNVFTAPELSRTLTVAPDGRVQLALGPSVVASGRTPEEVAGDLEQALAFELLDPRVAVVPTGFASQRIFVGGEVRNAGMFDLPGQIDPLQAILMAGGFTDTARTRQVILLRRQPSGEVLSAVLDIRSGINDPRLAAWTPLQRFDVVYVPKSKIAEENLFVQQYIRNALPLDFQFFYDIQGNR
jgi:polysaccharide export outer membrane protein